MIVAVRGPILAATAVAVITGASFAGTSSGGVIGPRLAYLRALQNEPPATLRSSPMARATADETALVSIRFATPPSPSLLAALESEGVQFIAYRNERLHTATVYPARIRWDSLEGLASRADIIQVESVWRAHSEPPLDVSRPEIEADLAWELKAPGGGNVHGEGIVIADFDTGIDVYHPMFWRADGDTLRWLDVNENGRFDAGTDAVDLDRDGAKGGREILSYMESPVFGGLPSDSLRFNAGLDWLYNDRNRNGHRDAGPSAGFTEDDPTFGELLFVAVDRNRNEALDPGERLIALRTCKVRAIYETTGVVRRRGTDLMQSEGDVRGHGTEVAGILAGGVPGWSRLAGVAPGAELLMGNNLYVSDPPFIVSLEVLIPWALAEGADVMLYEDGEWVWNFLDGSSNVETMMDEAAARGVFQVVPAGNLATGRMHMKQSAPPGESRDATIIEPMSYTVTLDQIWPSILWRGSAEEVGISLVAPSGATLPLDGSGDFEPLDRWLVYSFLSVSTRGTAKMDVQIVAAEEGTPLTGAWRFHLENRTSRTIDVHGYTWDNLSGWSGFGRWDAPAETATTTITWPATADSAITVAAYQPRGMQTLNTFSGHGPRIDGVPIMDLAAPGTTVFAPAPHELAGMIGAFGAFGGTSAAGPHVAGAIALLMQRLPEAGAGEIRRRLLAATKRDYLTGSVPNELWGYGRLRLRGALAPFAMTSPDVGAEAAPSGSVGDGLALHVSPNPAPGPVGIHYTLPRAGAARIELFDALGRRVAIIGDVVEAPTEQTFQWDRRLPSGERVAPGTYFVRVSQGHRTVSSKVILLP